MKFSKYLKNVNILYIEDDITINETTSEILSKLHYKVKSFVDSKEALNYYLENYKSIDLILSDINMPKISGIELVKKIKEKNKKIPIIIYTAYIEEEYLLKAISLGVNEYLKKPIDFRDLRNSINKAIYPSYLEKRNLEQNKLINQQSKDLLIAKTVSMISHQWKQPLARVSSIVSKLKVLIELNQLEMSDLKINLNKIEKEGKYLGSVINRFDEVLKKKKTEYFKVSTLINESLDLLNQEQKNIIDIDIIIDEDFFIFSNLNEFKTILFNLLINCVNNIKEKEIENGKVIIEAIMNEEGFFIKVIDNALGMNDENIKKAFDLYYSDEDLNKKGLGLYFVRLSLFLLIEGDIILKNIILNKEKGLEVSINIPKKYVNTSELYKDYQI